MMNEQLTKLRQTMAAVHNYTYKRQAYKMDGIDIKQGRLVYICGNAQTEWLTRFLLHHHSLQVAWIENNLSISPAALYQRKLELERVMFCEAKKHLLWASLQTLRSQLFEAVVYSQNPLAIETHALKHADIRRLQLAAEKSAAILFLLGAPPGQQAVNAMKIRAEYNMHSNNIQTTVLKG